MCGSARLCIGEDKLHLRHLHLTQSRLGDEDFGMLLLACAPGLETLVYEASYPFAGAPVCGYVEDIFSDVGWHQTPRPTDRLIRHLVKLRATLKSLHFDLRSRPESGAIWDGAYTTPLTRTIILTSFNVLEDVFISACSICSPEEPVTADVELLNRLLPPSVKTLKLAGERLGAATNRLANALLHLAKSAARGHGRFGAMERVRRDASMARVVDSMGVPYFFAVAGVDFGYESRPLSDAALPRGALLRWVGGSRLQSLPPCRGQCLPIMISMNYCSFLAVDTKTSRIFLCHFYTTGNLLPPFTFKHQHPTSSGYPPLMHTKI